jgi:hypothetical protein
MIDERVKSCAGNWNGCRTLLLAIPVVALVCLGCDERSSSSGTSQATASDQPPAHHSGTDINEAVDSGAARRAEEKEVTEKYRLTIISKLAVKEAGNTSNMDVKTVVRYTLLRKATESTLTFNAIKSRMKADGEVQTNFAMDRTRIVSLAMDRTKIVIDEDGDKVQETLAENASMDIQQRLKDTFEVPLCKITYDDAGQEIKRTVVASPGAKDIRQSGDINTALFMHVPFPANEEKW